MSKGNTFENDLLKLIFNGETIPQLADNTATSPVAFLYVALHTADPGEGGSQTTNEINYTGYARVAVARNAAGWTVTANSVSPTQNIDFPTGTGGSGNATHFSVGTALNGTGKILYKGTLTPSIACGNGVTPRISTNSTITED
ncbi:hypothetical protein vBCbaSRXM_155 [Citromicrobium phage vB_CbaS-RXM]|nr:hypothetical protein vBCbaSRXM_155 [Citromicrobium phage vB_CbaS-RXM]